MTVRAFIAIELPDDARHTLVHACAALKSEDHRWRGEKWVEPENLHITLKFLGNLELEALMGVSDVLAEECSAIREFDLTLARVHAVPGIRSARMLWAEFLDTDGECGLLSAAAERAAMCAGVPADERPFRPHATLVRARKPRPVAADALAAADSAIASGHTVVSVPAATVFTSELTRQGPIYSVHRRVPLAAR